MEKSVVKSKDCKACFTKYKTEKSVYIYITVHEYVVSLALSGNLKQVSLEVTKVIVGECLIISASLFHSLGPAALKG